MSRAAKMRGSSQGAAERDSHSSPIMQQQQHQTQQSHQQMQRERLQITVLTGSVAILWDMENCPVPSEVKADDVAGNIRTALRLHPVIQFGAVTFFSAYGDFNHFTRKVREGCQRTGVNLIDVPNGKKDASDKAILVDLFLFALDNAPPCTIFIISGDVDFAPALHKLGQRGYTVVLAIPSGVGVSSALCSAGRFVWDWPSVARGEGLVPAKNPSATHRKIRVEERVPEIIDTNASAGGQPGPGWSHDDDSDLASDDQILDEDEIFVYKAPAHPRTLGHAIEAGPSGSSLDGVQQRNSVQGAVGRAPPQVLYPLNPPKPSKEQVSASIGSRESIPVGRSQPGEASGPSGAKGSGRSAAATPTESLLVSRDELVRLLSLNGRKMELGRVPAEYEKLYGKPLLAGEYGHGGTKLMFLLERLREWLFVRENGSTKTLQLTKTGSRVAAKLRRDDAKSGRGAPREEEVEIGVRFCMVEVDDAPKIPEKDVGDEDDDETAGEAIVGGEVQGVQRVVTGPQPVVSVSKDHSQRSKGEHSKAIVVGGDSGEARGTQNAIPGSQPTLLGSMGMRDKYNPRESEGEHSREQEEVHRREQMEEVHVPNYARGLGYGGRGEHSTEAAGPPVAEELRGDADNGRGVVPREEEDDEEGHVAAELEVELEVGESTNTLDGDEGEKDDDETAGEEVIIGHATEGLRRRIAEIESIRQADENPRQSEGEHSDELRTISLPKSEVEYMKALQEMHLLNHEAEQSRGVEERYLFNHEGEHSRGKGEMYLLNYEGEHSRGVGEMDLLDHGGEHSRGIGEMDLLNHGEELSRGMGEMHLPGHGGEHMKGLEEILFPKSEAEHMKVFGEMYLSNHEGDHLKVLGEMHLPDHERDHMEVLGEMDLLNHEGEHIKVLGQMHLPSHEGEHMEMLGEMHLPSQEGEHLDMLGEMHLPDEEEHMKMLGEMHLPNHEENHLNLLGEMHLLNHEENHLNLLGEIHPPNHEEDHWKLLGEMHLPSHEGEHRKVLRQVHLSNDEEDHMKVLGEMHLPNHEEDHMIELGEVHVPNHELYQTKGELHLPSYDWKYGRDEDDDDETAGEEVVIGCATKAMQSLVTEVQSMLHRSTDPQRSEGAHSKESEDEIHLPNYDRGVSSGRPANPGDDETDGHDEEKDVEIDESTLEEVVKTKGKGRAVEWEELDLFGFELHDEIVKAKGKGKAGFELHDEVWTAKGKGRVGFEPQDEVVQGKGKGLAMVGWEEEDLDVFRLELQELLVIYACNIPTTDFVELYLQRYSRPLDYEKFGVADLESLIERVSDVAEIMEEPGSKTKVLVAHRTSDGRVAEQVESSGDIEES